MTETDGEKVRMRGAARRIRDARSSSGREAAALASLFEESVELERNASIGAYWPIGSEIDSRPLMADLARRGHAILLPVIDDTDHVLRFWPWNDGDTLEEGPFGTREPRPAGSPVDPDLLLVPLLAFDRDGARLGYGGGYYDRAIGNLRRESPAFQAIGLAFADQEVANVPMDDGDEHLDAIVTPIEIIRIGPR